jgi:hypothetical protein
MQGRSDNSAVDFYVEGVLAGTVSTTLPTANTNTFFCTNRISRVSINGTLDRTMYISYYAVYYTA